MLKFRLHVFLTLFHIPSCTWLCNRLWLELIYKSRMRIREREPQKMLDFMELIQHLGVESLLLCCELGSRSDGDRLLSVVLRLDTKSPQQNDPRCRPWSTQFNPFLYNISITYSRNSYNTSPTTILFRLKSASTKNHFNFLTKHAHSTFF